MYNQIYQGAFSAWRIGSWMTPYRKTLGQLWWWHQQIDLKVLCMQMVCKWGDTSICGVWVFGPLAPLCMMKLLLWSTWLSLATLFPIEKECESPQAKEQHLCRLHRAARLFHLWKKRHSTMCAHILRHFYKLTSTDFQSLMEKRGMHSCLK